METVGSICDRRSEYLEWPGHRQVIKVECWRRTKGGVTRQVRYAITSLGIRRLIGCSSLYEAIGE